MKKILLITIILIFHTNNMFSQQYILDTNKNLLTDYEPINSKGEINVVIEIPTGSIAKWEVTKPAGKLKWEFKQGRPKTVKYLSYPGNYGMIPRTFLPKEKGGDGDPLDVIVLSPPVKRGQIISAKLIGVLKLLDHGEQDDKLIAVTTTSPFHKIDSLKELDKKFIGVSNILELWFSNYKGPGKMESLGFGDKEEALKILHTAIEEFTPNPTIENGREKN